jgi:phage-related protein
MDDGRRPPRELAWVGASKRDSMAFPGEVQYAMGYALYRAQLGAEPPSAEAPKGLGSRSVLELVEDDPSGTYRAVYTARFDTAVHVLHAFQKKSKRGIETPQPERDMTARRLREAETIHRARSVAEGGRR